MRIKVEQKHIDNGRTKSTNCCPVALALIDSGFQHVHVMSFGYYVNKAREDEAFWFHPAEVNEFISNFDNERRVLPFEFILDEERLP